MRVVRSAIALALLLGCLGQAGPASAQSVEQVLQLARQGTPAGQIIATITENRTIYRLSAADMKALREAGTSPRVISFMLSTPDRFRELPPAPPSEPFQPLPDDPPPVPTTATPPPIPATPPPIPATPPPIPAAEGAVASFEDVVRLHQSGLPESVILEAVRGSGVDFQLTVEDLIIAKEIGLSEGVILAVQRSRRAGARPTVQPVPWPPPAARPTGGCTANSQCRRGRHCVAGRCAWPSAAAPPPVVLDQPPARLVPVPPAPSRAAIKRRLRKVAAKHKIEKRRGIPGLWIPGASTLAGSYLVSNLTAHSSCGGFSSELSCDEAFIALVPVAGPFILAGVADGQELLWTLEGVGQTIGMTMLILGLVLERDVKVPDVALGDAPDAAHLSVLPGSVGGRGGGLNVGITSF